MQVQSLEAVVKMGNTELATQPLLTTKLEEAFTSALLCCSPWPLRQAPNWNREAAGRSLRLRAF